MSDLSDRCPRCNSADLDEVMSFSYESSGERFTDEGYCCRQCGECFRFEDAVQPTEEPVYSVTDAYNARLYTDLKKHLDRLQEFNNIRNGSEPENERENS